MPPSAPNTAPTTLAAAPDEPVRVPPRVARGGEGAVVAQGQWTALAFSSRRDWTALADSLHALPKGDDAWDLRPIEQLDHIGAQVLWRHWGGAWPQRIEMDPPHKAVLEHVAQFTCAAPPDAGPTLADRFKDFAHHGPRALLLGRDVLRMIGQLVLDIGTLIRAPHRAPWRDLSGQLYQFGTTALPITALVGALIGVVLAYLMSNQLRNFGAEAFIVNILGLSLIRELGPVLAAVLVAGRSGSAITAQIGVMRVTEELDAMRVMGIPPGFRLVMPRVLALAIAMPLIRGMAIDIAIARGITRR